MFRDGNMQANTVSTKDINPGMRLTSRAKRNVLNERITVAPDLNPPKILPHEPKMTNKSSFDQGSAKNSRKP